MELGRDPAGPYEEDRTEGGVAADPDDQLRDRRGEHRHYEGPAHTRVELAWLRPLRLGSGPDLDSGDPVAIAIDEVLTFPG